MKTVIITGSQGFIGGYLCRKFLTEGWRVVGYDDYSKYGEIKRDYDNHTNFSLNVLDLSKNIPDFWQYDPQLVIMGAALIGGIATFHKYAFDLIRQNERILANCYDAVLQCANPPHVVMMSSSMVYEGADAYNGQMNAMLEAVGADKFHYTAWPSSEDFISAYPPPVSTYGAQKLMAEYWARGAWEQYGISYTIVRPFNCVGLGEEASIFDAEVMSGEVKLMMSHVLPDLMNKCLKGQNPLRILGDGSQIRCYTHGKDIAEGIYRAATMPAGYNNDFNISIQKPHTVLELAELVWKKVNPDKPFAYISDEPFEHDVQKRLPLTMKAEKLLGFKAEITLEETIDELYEHMRKQ